MEGVGRCQRCRMFADAELCPICSASSRDQSLLCVVESPADVAAIEQSGSYRGTYFVLMGHLSPLDGIGPDELGFAQLEALLAEGSVKEAILATNTTVEGDATAHVIAELAQRHKVKIEPHRARRADRRRARIRRRRHARARARGTAFVVGLKPDLQFSALLHSPTRVLQPGTFRARPRHGATFHQGIEEGSLT